MLYLYILSDNTCHIHLPGNKTSSTRMTKEMAIEYMNMPTTDDVPYCDVCGDVFEAGRQMKYICISCQQTPVNNYVWCLCQKCMMKGNKCELHPESKLYGDRNWHYSNYDTLDWLFSTSYPPRRHSLTLWNNKKYIYLKKKK